MAKVGGFYEGSALSDKTFYGFHLNDQGDCTIDVINDGTTVVKIPDQDTEILDPEAYKHWFWSSDNIDFEFDNSNGHLIMKML
jgi:hypothetical protein